MRLYTLGFMNFPRISRNQLRVAVLTTSLVASIPFVPHIQKAFSSEASGTDNLLSAVSPTPRPSPTASPDEIIRGVIPPYTETTPRPPEFKITELLDHSFGTDDVDCDGFKNAVDNCPIAFNPGQEDRNGNEIGDVCDAKAGGNPDRKDLRCDVDGDGLLDRDDNCVLVCNRDQKDKNKNGVGDACDPLLKPNFKRFEPCPTKSRKTRCR